MAAALLAHLALLEDGSKTLIERLRRHSFLCRCQTGTITPRELKRFLVQEGIHRDYFPRYLSALLVNLPSSGPIHRLADNLREELAAAEEDAAVRGALYREMLDHFGLTVNRARPSRATRRLVNVMFDHCRNPDVAHGLGAVGLGAAALVPVICSDFIAGFEACGTASAGIEFFHARLDCEEDHADTLWEIMLEQARHDPNQIGLMLAAGSAVLEARLSFLTSIESGERVRYGRTYRRMSSRATAALLSADFASR